MEQVALETLDAFVDRYAKARGGITNEGTDSEAMFVLSSQFGGAYVLSVGMGPIWIGIQNASARWTKDGGPFDSIRSALEIALRRHPESVFYSESSIERLQWMSERIKRFRAEKSLLLVAQ